MASKDPRRGPAGPTARRLTITGRVQGVGFRYFARTQADAAGARGWVRNLPDGRTVEVHLEGTAAAVLEAAERIGRGPAGARVEALEVREIEPEGATRFEIRA